MDSLLAFISALDSRTAALLVTLAFFFQASAIGAQFFQVREYKGLGTALLGNLSLAVGFALLLFRGILPDSLTIIVANTLVVLCSILYYLSVSQFTGQRFYNELSISGLVGILVLLLYFTYIRESLGARIIGISLVSAFNIFLMLTQFWKTRHAPYRFSILLISVPFGLYMIFLIIRAIVTAASPPTQLFLNSPVETATYLFLFIISFMWTFGFVLMVSQRLQIDLRELANTDSLTHIPNRRSTQLFLEQEFSRVERKGGEFSVLLIDIDNFKQINDTRGHAVGDLVLVNATKIFQSSIRKQDLAGRWGGEEFLLILPQTPLSDAKLLAERLRVRAMGLNKADESVDISISIGVASSNGRSSIEQILKKADDALYIAKTTKNAVVAAT